MGKGKILSLSFGVIWKNDNICIGILKRSPKVENDFKKHQNYIHILTPSQIMQHRCFLLLHIKNQVLPSNAQKAQCVWVVGDSVDLQVWLYVPHALPHNEATAGCLHTDIDKENLNYTLQHWLYASTATSI